MALAALGAVMVLDVGTPTAEAAPNGDVSPFAGSYVGDDPQDYGYRIFNVGSWAVTISDGGQITSSYSNDYSGAKGSISGRVRADGSYSFTVSVTHVRGIPRWRGGGADHVTERYEAAGDMALDVNGNIVGTQDPSSQFTNGGSFFWLRQ